MNDKKSEPMVIALATGKGGSMKAQAPRSRSRNVRSRR